MKSQYSEFEGYQIPTKKLAFIAGGYRVAGDAGSSCSSGTGSSSGCDGTANCQATCQCNMISPISATIESCFTHQNTAQLTPVQKHDLYFTSIDKCESQVESNYLASVLLQ